MTFHNIQLKLKSAICLKVFCPGIPGEFPIVDVKTETTQGFGEGLRKQRQPRRVWSSFSHASQHWDSKFAKIFAHLRLLSHETNNSTHEVHPSRCQFEPVFMSATEM